MSGSRCSSPPFGDVRDGAGGGFAELPLDRLRDGLSRRQLRAPDDAGQGALLARPGVSTQVHRRLGRPSRAARCAGHAIAAGGVSGGLMPSDLLLDIWWALL